MLRRCLVLIDQEVERETLLIELERRLGAEPIEIKVSMISDLDREASRHLETLIAGVIDSGRPAYGLIGGSDLPTALRAGLHSFAPDEVIVISEKRPESIRDLAERAAVPVTAIIYDPRSDALAGLELQAAVPRTFSPLEPLEIRALLAVALAAMLFPLLLADNPDRLILGFFGLVFLFLLFAYPTLLLIIHRHAIVDRRALILARWLMGLVAGSVIAVLLFSA
jgi:hypothetical protein